MEQAAKSTVTLAALSVVLVLVGIWGWNAATKPFPAKTEPPKCVATSIDAGEKVFPQQVTVSVYNASDRNGLAGQTMAELVEQGFTKGDTGNAPGNARVPVAAIWTDTPKNPDVLLLASRLGKSAEVVRRDSAGVGVTLVVGDDFAKLLPGKKAVVAERGHRDLQPARQLSSSQRPLRRGPSHWASRPPSETWRSRSSVLSRSFRGVTTNRSSPCLRTVRRSGTRMSPSRMTSETDAPTGSRSSPTSTPCMCDVGLIETWSRSAAIRSSGRGLDVQPPWLGPARDAEDPRDPGKGRPGQQGVDHDHHEDQVEQAFGVLDPFGERDGGEHDRDRAAQTGPGQERELAPRHRRPDGTHQHGQRTGDEGEDQASSDGQPGDPPGEVTGRQLEAEHDEEPDLRQPGNPFREGPGRRTVRELAVAEDQGGDVHGGETGAVDGGRAAVRQEGEDQRR